MRTLIVTAADETFAPLLQDLVRSLQAWQPRRFDALAVFDLGLSRATREWLEPYADHVVQPGWDLPVDDALRIEKPALRALTVRPFLNAYWPGYDLYLWLDADTWVQRADALPIYWRAAAQGRLAAAVSVDRAYRAGPSVLHWRTSRLDACFGPRSGERALYERYLNAGVFALAAEAPHWQAWQRSFEQGLKATGGRLVCDQSALNQAVWNGSLPITPLPAWLNWQCHLCAPRFDATRDLWMEPHEPAQAIGVMHLTSQSKSIRVVGEAGGEPRSMRFGGGRAGAS